MMLPTLFLQQALVGMTLWTACALLLMQPERFLANAAFSSSSFTSSSPAPSVSLVGIGRLTSDGTRRRQSAALRPVQSGSPHLTCFRRTTRIVSSQLFLSRDWIDEVNSMDDNSNNNRVDAMPGVAPDMKYVPRNVLRQNQNFVAIRQAGGTALTNDVYVRQPTTKTTPRTGDKVSIDAEDDEDDEMEECTFWYMGKIARVSDVTPQQAIQRQWNLIETHASQLRPLELYPARGLLEIFVAPGDSELPVAYHRPDVDLVPVPRVVTDEDRQALQKLKTNLMGFQGEIYNGGEEGFRTLRYSDGSPSRREIAAGSQEEEEDDDDDDLQTPTDDEMAKIQEKLQGQDLNALYEEQQRRAGKPIID